MTAPDEPSPADAESAPGFFRLENPALYLAPMFVYLLLGSFEPAAPSRPGAEPKPGWFGLTYDHYPWIYTAKLALTVVVLGFCAPAWRQWPLRVSALGVGVGVVGAALWIGVCEFGAEGRLIDALGDDSVLIGLLGLGRRAEFNPFEHFGYTATCYAFLAVRFVGLALVVPLFEELMLRGWLMRNMVSPEFWRVEFGRVTATAVVVGTAFPMLYHPEKVASLAWFTLVTWLMVRTKNFWDCVVAHGVTNLLLGVYVLWAGAWYLW